MLLYQLSPSAAIRNSFKNQVLDRIGPQTSAVKRTRSRTKTSEKCQKKISAACTPDQYMTGIPTCKSGLVLAGRRVGNCV